MSSENYQPLKVDAYIDAAPLQARIDGLSERENGIAEVLEDMDRAFALKRAPVEDEWKSIVEEKERLMVELAKIPRTKDYPLAPGPSVLEFVDSSWFSVACNAVVVLNLACMTFSRQLQPYGSTMNALNQLFLVWYMLELGLKWMYHRNALFFGSLHVVWWNWLDASIVVGGILDQWLMALVQHILPWKVPALSTWLRWLRLFRVMRFLRVLKAFIQGDLSWTEKAPFQVTMAAVIGVNSVVLALELDVEWDGWQWFEQVFLIIYTFELAVRLKEFRCSFFVNEDLILNNLDFAMVCGGAFDLWLTPAWYAIQALLYGTQAKRSLTLSRILTILKMTKILRVLRLVRLLRMVKPLYTLLVGVMSALDAMKWVLILTVFLLYAGAIVFTSLIGHGLIYHGVYDVPPEAEDSFGSVTKSIFSLFKLMNGDMKVVNPITSNPAGRLLFAAFMVISNWAVLAILTSVVSDHMISTSQRVFQDYKQRDEEEQRELRTKRLRRFFSRLDKDHDGKITHSEWISVVRDPELGLELSGLTNLDTDTLEETMHCLSRTEGEIDMDSETEYFLADDFVTYLNHDHHPADRRQVLHQRYCLEKATLSKFRQLENHMQHKFEALEAMLEQALQVSPLEKGAREKKRLEYPVRTKPPNLSKGRLRL